MDNMNWEKDPDSYREEILNFPIPRPTGSSGRAKFQNSNYVITPIRIAG
jgi:hypothetical protein